MITSDGLHLALAIKIMTDKSMSITERLLELELTDNPLRFLISKLYPYKQIT